MTVLGGGRTRNPSLWLAYFSGAVALVMIPVGLFALVEIIVYALTGFDIAEWVGI